jgi:hypothetical protein
LEATVNGTIIIPAGAPAGFTRMRVAMQRGADPSSCDTLLFGEVEDYTVNVSGGDENDLRSSAIQLEAVPGLDVVNLFAVLQTKPEAVGWRLEKSSGHQVYEELFSGSLIAADDEYVVFEKTDDRPGEGENFYRLTLHDALGNPLSEAFASAQFHPVEAFEIFPNPAVGEFFVELSKLKGQAVTVEVFNSIGHSVYREFLPESNENFHTIETEGWLDGMYFVVVTPEGRRPVTKRVVIGRI